VRRRNRGWSVEHEYAAWRKLVLFRAHQARHMPLTTRRPLACAPWLRTPDARLGCTALAAPPWLHRLGCAPQCFLLCACQALYEQHKEATRSWLHMHYRLLLLLSSLATVLGIVALAIFPNGDVGRVGSDGEDIFDSAKVGPLPLLLPRLYSTVSTVARFSYSQPGERTPRLQRDQPIPDVNPFADVSRSLSLAQPIPCLPLALPDPEPEPSPGPGPDPDIEPEQVGSFRWSWNLGTTVLTLALTAVSSALLRYTPQADRSLEECDAAIAQCDKLVAMCAEMNGLGLPAVHAR